MGKKTEAVTWSFIVEKGNIVQALGRVLGAIDRRSSIPSLSHVKIDVLLRGAICITATDLEMVATVECPATVPAAGGAVCVPAELFKGALAANSGQIEISLRGLKLEIEGNDRRYELACLPAGEFPQPPQHWESPACYFEPGVLSRLLKAVGHAICQDEAKYNLCGVYLCQDQGRLTAVASDGHRLSLAGVELPEATIDRGFLLPAKAVRILSTVERGVTLSVGTPGKNDSQVLFDQIGGGFELSVRLMDGQFPPYRRIIPDDHGDSFTVDSVVLAAAIEAAAVVSEAQTKSATLHATEEHLGEGLTVSALGACGVATATVPCLGGTGYKTTANAKYLMQALKSLGGEVFIKHGGTAPTVLMVPVDHDTTGLGGFDERLEIVMPYKVK